MSFDYDLNFLFHATLKSLINQVKKFNDSDAISTPLQKELLCGVQYVHSLNERKKKKENVMKKKGIRNVPKHVGFAQYNNTALIQSDGLVYGDGVDHAHGILRLGHQRRDAFFQVDDTMAGFDTGDTFQHYGQDFVFQISSQSSQISSHERK